jgi:hypothetical protein
MLPAELPVLEKSVMHDLFSISTAADNPKAYVVQPLGHDVIYLFYVDCFSHQGQVSPI